MRLSYTSLSDWRRCHRLWEWEQSYAPKTTPPALWFGDLIHQSLAHYYSKTRTDPMSAVALFQSNAKRRAHEIQDDDTYDDLYDLGTKVLEHYVWWASDNDLYAKLRCQAVEQRFEVPLEQDLVFTGVIDAKLTMGAKKKKYLHEIKTMATIEKEWLTLTEQATSYLWAEAILHPKDKYDGVVFTLIRKKAPTEPEVRKDALWLASNASSSVYTVRHAMESCPNDNGLLKKYQDMEDTKGNDYVQRITVTRTPEQIRAFGDRIKEIWEEMQASARFPNPNPITCRGCGFRDACVAKERGDNWQLILDQLYRRRT